MTQTRSRKGRGSYQRRHEDIVPGAWTDPWTPTEAEFTRLMLQLARAKGWQRRYHTHDSRRSSKGFPDWVMVHPGQKRILFLELKGYAGKPGEEQLAWLEDLGACGAEAYLVSTTGDKAHDMAALAELFDPPRAKWAEPSELQRMSGLCVIEDGPPPAKRCIAAYALADEAHREVAAGRWVYAWSVGGIYQRCGGYRLRPGPHRPGASAYCYSHDPEQRRRSAGAYHLRRAAVRIAAWQRLYADIVVPRDRLADRIERMGAGYFG